MQLIVNKGAGVNILQYATTATPTLVALLYLLICLATHSVCLCLSLCVCPDPAG